MRKRDGVDRRQGWWNGREGMEESRGGLKRKANEEEKIKTAQKGRRKMLR